ncbi:Hypothetical protein POVR1_LOCUS594 [uncultured virus]|nr:Hypothetical protein POVR1_LOCUS594 [uncultured virus]
MKFYDPVTKLEASNLLQPITCLFTKNSTRDLLGYRLFYKNVPFYESQDSIKGQFEEIYFYDPVTVYRVFVNRQYSSSPQLNRSIARKVTIDTFNYIVSEFSPRDLDIYYEGVSAVLNIPSTVSNVKSVILEELRKFNEGIRYKESIYDPKYIVNPGTDLPPPPVRVTENLFASPPSAPRRAPPPIPGLAM